MSVLDNFFLFPIFFYLSIQQYQPPPQLQLQQQYPYHGNQQEAVAVLQTSVMQHEYLQKQQKQYQQSNLQQRRGPPQRNSYQPPVATRNQFNQNSRFQQQQHRDGSNPSLVNTPTKLAAYDHSINGALVRIRLTSYQNPTMALSKTTTCICPVAYCDFLPQNQQNACSFSFVTVISSAYQSVQYIQSDFYPFYGSISTGNWTNPHSFQMISKPVSIDIFVQHLGVSINRTTANLLFFAKLILVDTFIVDLSKFQSNGGGDQSLSLVGHQLGTQLQLTLNIQCINGMMGEMCDLSCTIQPSSTTSNYAICLNNRTGEYFNCSYNTFTFQVSQCELCRMNGYFDGSCETPIPVQYIVASSAFRVWTIILGCLLGLATLVILCLIVSYMIVKNREHREDHFKYKTSHKYMSNKGNRFHLDEQEWSRLARKPVAAQFEDTFIHNGVTSTNTRQEHQV